MRQLAAYVCDGEPVPQWLRDALYEAVRQADMSEIDSWDAVLGPPMLTGAGRPARGKTRRRLKQDGRLPVRIYDLVTQLTQQGRSVDNGLFKEVAEKLGVGRKKTEDTYYRTRAIVELMYAATASLGKKPPSNSK